MLVALSVRNLLLIDHLNLEFSGGLNVLTGETGAGKSIILDCLGFVLGWRGRANIVREGADLGEVEAHFAVADDHPALGVLAEAGIPHEPGELLILRRQVNADGRKRGYLNDRAVSGELLRQIGDHLVELHGQHDDKGLLNDKTHIVLLDRFAGVDTEKMAGAYREYRAASKAYEDFLASKDEAARELDFLDHAIAELDTLNPEEGEDQMLDSRRRLMQQGEKQASRLDELRSHLSSEALNASMARALRIAQDLADKLAGEAGQPGAMEEIAQQLSQAYDQIADASGNLDRLASALEFDPLVLEAVEERLFAIRAAARKYAVSPDDLPALLVEMRAKREVFGDVDRHDDKLRQARDNALDTARVEAAALSAQRNAAAHAMANEVAGELAPLKLAHAKFAVEITPRDLQANGQDEVRFVVQTNPGSPAGPLSKIASGGELSRFLLALKIVLHGEKGAMLIFDEIDRGVGGSTADAVGRRLLALSEGGQSLVVTHSPQVSAQAMRHFRVDKEQSSDTTTTRVVQLDREMRVDEIARMISGEAINEATRTAARSLLGH